MDILRIIYIWNMRILLVVIRDRHCLDRTYLRDAKTFITRSQAGSCRVLVRWFEQKKKKQNNNYKSLPSLIILDMTDIRVQWNSPVWLTPFSSFQVSPKYKHWFWHAWRRWYHCFWDCCSSLASGKSVGVARDF